MYRTLLLTHNRNSFTINIFKALREGQTKTECTYSLTDDGVFDSIDATGKHGEGQRSVEAEVQ